MTKPRVDQQLTGMAGEFLTVGKLFKRGYQTLFILAEHYSAIYDYEKILSEYPNS